MDIGDLYRQTNLSFAVVVALSRVFVLELDPFHFFVTPEYGHEMICFCEFTLLRRFPRMQRAFAMAKESWRSTLTRLISDSQVSVGILTLTVPIHCIGEYMSPIESGV